MHCRILLALALGFGAIGTPAAALAQAVDPPPPPLVPRSPPRAPAAPSQWIVLEGWAGAGTSSAVDRSAAAVAALGATGLYHGDWLELGAGLTWQPSLAGLGTSSVMGTLLAGVKVDPAPRLRLELLAEGGIDHVSLGGGLSQTVESGGIATLPYIGGRIGVSLPLGRTRRLVIGWWVSGGAAIGPVVVHSVVTNCNSAMFCSTAPQTDTIGGATWSSGLRIGGEIWQW
jgi:hypothetical protein